MEKKISSSVSIYALGGLGEVGKNMYCIENEEQIIIIDAGVRFPGVEFPGIDYIVPDYTHLKNNRNKIKALIITHGHEDHIGGIPFLLQNVNIPVIYAPKLACALINNRLEEQRLSSRGNVLEYGPETELKIGSFKISFFRVTHSIPDSFGVVVETDHGVIVSTGDFKIDLTPIGPDVDLHKMAELGNKGVHLLLSDSTNAENEGHTPSEKNVFDSINEIFDNTKGRLIISTFSSNISRIQQICESAVLHGRKIAIIGRSMEKTVELSRAFGYIRIPDNSLISASDIKLHRNNEVLVICTGSQGEPMAALSRIASGDHKDLHIIPGDTVVFSSSPIPGNGIMIDHVVNLLTRAGAEVVTNTILNDIHSSGHPAKEELRLVLKLFKPKYFMPMHGEYRMLRIHGELATTVGIPSENIFVLNNGDSLTLTRGKVTKGYPVDHGNTYIDGKDIKGLADTVMEDRRILTDDGMLAITIAIDTKKNILMSKPEFSSMGMITLKQAYYDELCHMLEVAISEILSSKPLFSDIKNLIKKLSSAYIFSKTHREPMIIPIIMSKN